MKASDIVVVSAQLGADTVGDDLFFKLTQNAVTLVGAELARHIRDGERPGVLSPLEVVIDGKDRLGAILVLEDRAILAWTIGTLRMRNFEEVIPLAAVTDAVTGERPRGVMTKARDTLTIYAGKTWHVVFANTDRGRPIAPFIAGLLVGAIKPVFRDGDDPAEPSDPSS